ncbi:hypothetical protein N7520_010862 [Penicillium odoratum]|uniref:uncharacterized protein n=1 Tax=Penicillium odoratum TaxID=1167516 RepID=UPI0025474C70|nr:uncharacterized protein N7520_010862 [Penicillium odoratum]KAJ5745680.1 hypothetical protein N7520_010862 [Penicillium odoratum]
MTPQPQTRSSDPKQINVRSTISMIQTMGTNKDDEVSAEFDCQAFKSRILIEWTWPSTRNLPSTKHRLDVSRVCHSGVGKCFRGFENTDRFGQVCLRFWESSIVTRPSPFG